MLRRDHRHHRGQVKALTASQQNMLVADLQRYQERMRNGFWDIVTAELRGLGGRLEEEQSQAALHGRMGAAGEGAIWTFRLEMLTDLQADKTGTLGVWSSKRTSSCYGDEFGGHQLNGCP